MNGKIDSRTRDNAAKNKRQKEEKKHQNERGCAAQTFFYPCT